MIVAFLVISILMAVNLFRLFESTMVENMKVISVHSATTNLVSVAVPMTIFHGTMKPVMHMLNERMPSL